MPRWPTTTPAERFWRHVDHTSTPDGCWPWTATLSYDGYGLWELNDVGGGAHRFAYQFAVGPIPEGMTVDHLCFNPPCCRPDHLRVLSVAANRENQRSAHATHCVNGHLFDEANTYRRLRGGRDCRACVRERQRRYHQRKRSA